MPFLSTARAVAAAALVLALGCSAEVIDTCIVGAGPGGLQLAHFLHYSERSYVVLDGRAKAGGSFQEYPRHRRLISINKQNVPEKVRHNEEFKLRHDWNSLLLSDLMPEADRNAYVPFGNYSTEYYPSADSLVEYLGTYAETLNVVYDTEVVSVTRNKKRAQKLVKWDVAAVTAGADTAYACGVVVMATGLSEDNVPAVAFGAELAETYSTMSTNVSEYVGKDVVIIGGGNAAFETANAINKVAGSVQVLSRSPIRLSWATHYPGDVRAINAQLLEAYALKSLDTFVLNGMLHDPRLSIGIEQSKLDPNKINVGFVIGRKAKRRRDIMSSPLKTEPKTADQETMMDLRKKAEQLRIQANQFLQPSPTPDSAKGKELELSTAFFHEDHMPPPVKGADEATLYSAELSNIDKLIFATGFKWGAGKLFADADRPKSKSKKYAHMTPFFESANSEGVFFAGTLMHGNDFRQASGGFVHGFRYLCRALHRSFEETRYGNPWPVATVTPAENYAQKNPFSKALTGHLLGRIMNGSGLYQMFGNLVDVAVLGDDPAGPARYFNEVPVHGSAQFAVDHASGGEKKTGPVTFVSLMLDYGHDLWSQDENPFNGNKVFNADLFAEQGPGRNAQFLHPKIRLHRCDNEDGAAECDFYGSVLSEHHFAEDLATQFSRPQADQMLLQLWLGRHEQTGFDGTAPWDKAALDEIVDHLLATAETCETGTCRNTL